MARSLFVLLPPSEAKVHGGFRVVKEGSFDEGLRAPRREVVTALAGLLEGGPRELLEKTLKVRGPLLERALESSLEVVRDAAPLLPAWKRYSGVVWSSLGPETLRRAQRRRILVPSGLYGITSAEDFVADYRLKMNVSLAPIGNLASFWKPHLTPALLEFLEGATVVNLLPREHEAAIDLAELNRACDVVTISFVDHHGDRAAGHDAKAVKGVVAREILTGKLDSMASFRWGGWKAGLHDGEFRVAAPRR